MLRLPLQLGLFCWPELKPGASSQNYLSQRVLNKDCSLRGETNPPTATSPDPQTSPGHRPPSQAGGAEELYLPAVKPGTCFKKLILMQVG